MAKEACGRHQVWTAAEPSVCVVRQLSVKKRRYWLPESCRLAERRSMLAIPCSQLSGFSFRSPEWPYVDSRISVASLPEVKRPKILSGTLPEGSERTLATVNGTNTPSEKSISGFVSRTDSLTDGSKDGKRDYEEIVSSDGEDLSPETSERKHHVDSRESWKLRVVASSRCRSPSLLASNVISTIDFNDNGNLFATGGIARKIRICSYSNIVSENEKRGEDEDLDLSEDEYRGRTNVSRRRSDSTHDRDNEFAVSGEICTPGKLSSLKWRPDSSEVIGCGDYDGVVLEWSVEHGHTVSERYEHSGRRVWSLDYSKLIPTVSASASADGTVRIWGRGVEKSVSVITPQSGNSVCSVEFNPVAQNVIAVASADANVYLYDLRKPDVSFSKLSGHDRAVSYVRFLGKDKLVSASIDSTLKLWDISESVREVEEEEAAVDGYCRHGRQSEVSDVAGQAYLVRTFSAHTNVRHFAGLSIHRGASILACGSETDEVYLYRDSSTAPLVHHKFPSRCVGYSGEPGGSGNSYVGAVCWREQGDSQALVAANSEGVVQVFQVINC